MVDSSVLLDVLTDDVMWWERSRQALARATDEGRLAISPIVYVEVSIGFDQIEDLGNAVSVSEFERESLPYEAGFLASKEFVDYRRRGGERRSPLPDFCIGAPSPYADTDCSPEMSIDTARRSRRWRYLLPDAKTNSGGEPRRPGPRAQQVRPNPTSGGNK
jgi:predicted nucleic acid-binding protein